MPASTVIPAIGFAVLASYYVARVAVKSGCFGYHRYNVVAVPLASMPDMPRGFTVRALNPQELSEYTIDADLAVQSERFAKGMTCLAAFNSKQQLTGVNWITASPFLEDEVHIRFHTPIDAVWDTGLWIHQDHRMGRTFAALWAGTGDWLRSNNYQWSMSRIADYNMPAIRSHKRMGAINLGSIIFIRILRWQFAAKGRPRVVKVNSNQPAIFYPVVAA